MPERFYAGDRVRVRSWDDMLNQYGLVDDYDCEAIDTGRFVFQKEMEYLCGLEFTIKTPIRIEAHGNVLEYASDIDEFSFVDVDSGIRFHWVITTEMLELVDPDDGDEEDDGDQADLMSILMEV